MERLLALLPEQSMSIPLRYGMTAIIMLVCAALQLGLQLQSGLVSIFLLVPGVFLAGFMFDRGTGYFAAVLGTGVATLLIGEALGAPRQLLPLTLFAITAVGTASVAETLRGEMKKVARSERAKTLLLSE